MDEHFRLFVEEFAPTSSQQLVPAERFESYGGVLPNCLLSYWKEYGWASYSNGLIWLADPDLYVSLINNWLAEVPELQGSEYFVFARTAFGDLYAFRPDTGSIICINSTLGWVSAGKDHDTPTKNRELRIQSFFGSACQEDFDLFNERGEPFFHKVNEQLGPLRSDEVYGFDAFLTSKEAGGLTNVKRLPLLAYLSAIAKIRPLVLRTT